MKLKAVSGMMLTLLLISMLTIAFNIQPVSAGLYPAIYVYPASTVDTTLTPGKNYTVSIRTNYTGDDIWGWDFTLTYNPLVLNFISIINGDLITEAVHSSATFKWATLNETTLRALACFTSYPEPVPLTSGPGILANVTFTVVGTGDSDITLGPDTVLQGWTEGGSGNLYKIIDGETMPTHIQHGYFDNRAPTVTFRVDPAITPGVPVDDQVEVNVSIEADPGTAVIGWTIAIKVDPDVLKPGYWVSFPPPGSWKLVKAGIAGYFLYDWCWANDWRYPGDTAPTQLMKGSRNETTGTISDTNEAIKLWVDLGVGVGADGTGTLATFYFTSLNETAWSPIEITKAYYYTSWNSPSVDERVPDLIINGHYNTPAHDVAVTDVSAPPNATVGDSVSINVSILNQGANTETFKLEVFNDTTLIENRSVSLASSASGLETFTWNTTGMDPGKYTITANATLATDVDPSNNMRNTTIELKSALGGDAAVTNIAPSISEAYTTWTIQVNVTVLNNGIQTMNCTTVAYYHNGTTWVQMGTENVTNMLAGENATLTFDWNLAGVPYCNRTVKANAILLGANDTNPTNNEAYSWVKVRATGDVNGDGNVSVADIVEVDIALGSPWHWIHPYADVNGDGSISVADMVLIDIHLGETC